ncbi:MAG: DUF1214 domain-containing protein [Pseudomonadota bacterium]
MGFLFRTLLSIVAAIAIGVVSAWYAIDWHTGSSTVSVGTKDQWRHNLVIGTQSANPYDKAVAARQGLVYLPQEDALYFSTEVDITGDPLTGACRYRVTGANLPSDWWSISAYDGSGQLMANEDERYSVTLGDVPPGNFTFILAGAPQPELWLPVETGQPFSLVLRLYGPEPEFSNKPGEINLPRIEEIDCR